MNKIRILLSFILCLTLASCQQASKKPQISSSDLVNELLKSIIATAISEQQYDQAEKGIFGLMLNSNAGDWPYLQTAIRSMPDETAMKILENAVRNSQINSSAENLFNLSKVYISYKDTERALETVNQSIEKNPKNLDAIYWRARLYTVMKKYELARADFKHVIKSDDKNQEYKEQYASLLQELEEFDAAQEVLKEVKPTIQTLYKRLIFALQNENMDEAESAFKLLQMLEVDEDQQIEKDFLLAESAYWLKKWDLSEVHYKRVTGGDNFLNARQMLSFILYEQERYEEARELLHQLQNAELEYAIQAYLLESQILNRQGKTQQAIDTLSNSLEIIPDNKEILYNRAMLFEAQDKIEWVKKDLLKAVEVDPEFAEAYNALGYSMADRGIELEQALEYITKALEMDPENAAILDSMGWVLYKLNRFEEAETYLLKAHGKDYKDVEIYMHLHQIQLKLNKQEEAQSTLKQAKELFSEDEKFQKYLQGLEQE